MNRYPVGQSVRIHTATAFTDENGTAADPTAIRLVIGEPDGTTTTYTYADDEITRTGAGAYEKVVTPDQAGTWVYRWEGDFTDGTAVDEDTFFVMPSGTG